ncbi:WLM-domain-containing protein [Dentipellis sp. KUC8613]|nr:WLM-domain-containing protein [Dentipellis sp. KUC8613]
MASSSSSETPGMSIIITHRGQMHTLSLPAQTKFSALCEQLAELTNIPPENQKLLYAGKKWNHAPDATLVDVGLKAGSKVTLLGTTAEEIGGLHKVEEERRRRERIMEERRARGTPKVRSTGPSTPSASSQYRFHRIEPLAHLPAPDTARATLARLAADPAIQHVMRTHRLAVGLLTELAPHEAPHLLGLNENAGQAVKLRIRTDAYDGFRSYAEVRRVLCHELTHNVWGDHDDNFKAMNSQLNREVAEFERAAREGTHTLSGPGAYEPASTNAGGELEAEARAYVLGGSGAATPRAGETAEERRQRVLDATMRRLRREEEELEQSCGTAPAQNASEHA